MPISKRDKKVDLTKVQKKHGNKSETVEKIRRLINQFKNVFIIQFHNCRNDRLKMLRDAIKPSVILYAKNTLTSIALGKGKDDSFKPNLHKLCAFVKGDCALLFSDMEVKEIRQHLNSFRESEYARPGNVCSQTVIIPAEPMNRFIHTDEPALRKLGLPTKLVKGIVTVEKEYCICTRGKPLTPEQCRLLKYFEIQQAEFHASILAQWNADTNKVIAHKKKDAFNIITSLEPCIKVHCSKLDDGLFYFVPEPFQQSEHDRELNTMDLS